MFLTVSAAAGSFRTPFSDSLENRVRGLSPVLQNGGAGRLAFVLYFPPYDRMPEEVSFWDKLFGTGEEQKQIYATAVYLFNMYISTAAYGEDVPSRLTTDYMGALDAFGRIRTMYKTASAYLF